MRRKQHARWFAFGLAIGLAACSSTTAPVPPTVATSSVEVPASSSAHLLVTMTNGCWFGEIWHDALGEQPPVERCRRVLETVYGTVDHHRLERLRAFEPNEVAALGARIVRIAEREHANAAALGRLYDISAQVQLETMMARRAADRVKMDEAGIREPSRRLIDEADAVPQLQASGGLARALTDTTGDAALDAELRIVGLLCATDRMSDARGLPKHMKIYAVEGPFDLLFRVRAPEPPADVRKPLKAGKWLEYLTDVARAAKHPVPDTARFIEQKELAAWGGVLAGFADMLRAEAEGASGEAQRVAIGASARLEDEHRHTRAMLTAAAMTDSSDFAGQAVGFVVRSAACWLGDVWSDAIGERDRPVAAQARCRALTRSIYDDEQTAWGSYDSLRAVDPRVTSDMRERLTAIADLDAVDKFRKPAVLRFFDAVAFTARENERVRKSAGKMSASPALQAFLDVDAKELTNDAHVMALLFALDRLEIARGLPPALKVQSVAGPLAKMFAAQVTGGEPESTSALAESGWLLYLRSAAKSAGHEVPEEVPIDDMERVAWTSVLEGVAGEIRATPPSIPILADVSRCVTTRIDSDYSSARNLALSRGTGRQAIRF